MKDRPDNFNLKVWMTTVFTTASKFKQERVRELTLKGLKPVIIAERLGLTTNQVYYYQRTLGLRKKTKQDEL